MKKLQLTQGFEALVDNDIYEFVKHLKWRVCKRKNTNYAKTSFGSNRQNYQTIYLHHVIMGLPLNNTTIDHKDGDGLNNQRNNLRVVTKRKNQQNTKKHRSGKLLGAVWHKGNKRWMAQIYAQGKNKFLGYFATPEEASKMHKEASSRLS